MNDLRALVTSHVQLTPATPSPMAGGGVGFEVGAEPTVWPVVVGSPSSGTRRGAMARDPNAPTM